MAEESGPAPELGSTKITDEIFMMECLKHLTSPAAVDVQAVADALKYSNYISVSNRLNKLKKKYSLRVSSTTGGASKAAGDDEGSSVSANPTPVSTPRKGAKATKGPIKAKAPKTEDDTKGDSPAKPAKKAGGGRKRKNAAAAATTPPEEPAEEAKAEATKNGDIEVKAEEPVTPKAEADSE